MRKVIFWLWFLNGLVQQWAQELDLQVSPTVTQNEVVATWGWSDGPDGPDVSSATLFFAVAKASQTITTITITSEVTGPTQGTIPFSVSEPGSFQAILSVLGFPILAITNTFTSISPPTSTPKTALSSTTNPPSLTSSSSESDATHSLTSSTSVSSTSASSSSIVPSSISSTISIATSTDNPGAILVSTITESGATLVTTVSSSPSNSAATGASIINPHSQPSIPLLVGSILGAVVTFLLLASLVYCLWRRRRIQHEIVVVSPFPGEVRSAEEEPSSMEQRQTTHPAILYEDTRPPKNQRRRIPRPSLPTREPKRARQAPVRIEAPVVAENHREESVETNAEPTPDIDVVIQSENNPTSYRHQDSGWRDLIRSETADGLREVIELPPDYSEV